MRTCLLSCARSSRIPNPNLNLTLALTRTLALALTVGRVGQSVNPNPSPNPSPSPEPDLGACGPVCELDTDAVLLTQSAHRLDHLG